MKPVEDMIKGKGPRDQKKKKTLLGPIGQKKP
jgi:hypothetical protein